MSTAISTFEIKDTQRLPKDEAKKLVSAHYHDKLTYNGQEFFDAVYMNRIVGAAERVLELNDNNAQESYLGYIPSLDTFVSGFDTWENDEDSGRPHGVALVKLTADGVTASRDPLVYNRDAMIYGSKNGAYKELHKKYPDLIDIRLD